MMWNHNFTMMNEDEDTADPVGKVLRPSTTTMPSKTMMRSTGPRSFGRRMVRAGAGLLLLLFMAEGAVVLPQEEAAAEEAGWSNLVSSSPGRQGRVVGADRASKAAVAEEGVVVMEDGHDTTSSRRYDFAAAGAGAVVTAQDGSRLYEFPRRPETTAAATAKEDGIEMMEDGSRTHEFSTPRRVNIKNSKKTSQSLAELSEQSGSYTTHPTLYIVRHANKRTGSDVKATLCEAGRTRAKGLVKFFDGKTKFDGKTHAKPDHLVAHMYDYNKYHNTQRCLETIDPIAKALGNKYIHKVEYDKHLQNKNGAKKIKELLKSNTPNKNQVVLAVWEHQNIPNLIYDLGFKGQYKKDMEKNGTYLPCKYSVTPKHKPEYPGDLDFDYVYHFYYGKGHTEPPTYVSCHYQHIPIPCKPDFHRKKFRVAWY